MDNDKELNFITLKTMNKLVLAIDYVQGLLLDVNPEQFYRVFASEAEIHLLRKTQ